MSIVPLNFLKENTVCPKVLTTGIPRTYSTASPDISASAFWYWVICSCIFLPVMLVITAKASATGTRLKSPSRQSNASSSVRSPAMVAMAFA